MKIVNQMITLVFLGALFSAFCEPEEVTLQRGLNQYIGCMDSYLSCNNPTTNYGNSKTLKIRCDGG